jgi:hypothetical protein
MAAVLKFTIGYMSAICLLSYLTMGDTECTLVYSGAETSPVRTGLMSPQHFTPHLRLPLREIFSMRILIKIYVQSRDRFAPRRTNKIHSDTKEDMH